MPVLKVKNNGEWQDTFGISSHTHKVSDITDFPTNLPANGGDADTVDGKHASDFASASDVETLKAKVGDTSVSEQITSAIPTKVSTFENDSGYITADKIPSSLPTVTAENNGAFLQVVDGVWAVSSITNAEEVSF